MKKTTSTSDKLFIGFGILTMISGLFLIMGQDYLIGISGSCVGALIIYQNVMQIKNKEQENTNSN